MKTNRRFFSIRLVSLFALVVVLGLVLALELTAPPGNETTRRYGIYPNQEGSRSPASVPAMDLSPSGILEPDRITTIQWDCSAPFKSKRLHNVTQVRISGKCLRDLKKITNNNNGYTASIFKFDQQFTTDYLSLEVGTNQLEFLVADSANDNFRQNFEIIVEKQ